MTKLPDISAEVHALCDRFDLRYDCVARLEILPNRLIAEVYKLNEQGQKYLVDADGKPVAGSWRAAGDEIEAQPAMTILEVPVKT